MSADEPVKKKSLKKKVADTLHPPPSEAALKAVEQAARRTSLAMETLVDLLTSQDEAIRLKAAQLLLDYSKVPAAKAAPAPTVEAIEKLAKRL